MAISQPQILIVEDEPAQREILHYNLTAEGFRVTMAHDGEDGLLLVNEDPPDVIVLDWMMPHLSGIEVCRRLKTNAATCDIPIIMLSAKSEDFDKVRGLETGADDYVTKPYSVAELTARIRNQLRRSRPLSVGKTLQHGDITVDADQHKVTRAGRDIKLGPIEFKLLCTFIERPGRVLSRDQLLDRVWGRDVYVDTRTVDVHVGRLRKALKAPKESDPIRTVRGTGYSLN